MIEIFAGFRKAYRYIKGKMYLLKRDILSYLGKNQREKTQTLLLRSIIHIMTQIYKNKEGGVVPNEQIGDKIIYTQPPKIDMSSFTNESDDEIVFEKNNKHLNRNKRG